MEVNLAQHQTARRLELSALFLTLALAGTALSAQTPNPSSATNPFYGSVTAHPATDEILKLSLDEAVRMGLENNLGLKQAESDERALHGQKNSALQNFLPSITVGGDIGVHQHNLAALGFGPGVIGEFSKMFPGGKMPAGLSYITRDDLTEGQIQFSQILFSGPVIAAYKGVGAAEKDTKTIEKDAGAKP